MTGGGPPPPAGFSIHRFAAAGSTNDIARDLLRQGAAEIVGYLALDDEDLTIEMDDADETVLEYTDPGDPDVTKRARLPKVTVRRR